MKRTSWPHVAVTVAFAWSLYAGLSYVSEPAWRWCDAFCGEVCP
ncbi:hypothetical protein ACT3R7_11855 [Halomonas sp. AOP43-A1-21]